ncbi:MAG: acyl-CoA reductase-like NAD-dependent aldehyde dehydrogenase [Phenylobacterium sp.]|jgi:acyl-CoA reductase-like NAD-dependent aldehyde dehydrogenase
MMKRTIQIISPVDDCVIAQRDLASSDDIQHAVKSAVTAQQKWRQMSITQRAAFCNDAIDFMLLNKAELGLELARQMGRPVKYAEGELVGLAERGRHMIKIAQSQLYDRKVGDKVGVTRFIRREPLGVVFTIAPWNYPYLTAVNSIIPALMAGNTVILKHSAQTLLCAERFFEAFEAVGLPHGVFQYLHLSHQQTSTVIQHKDVAFVSFTGSVSGGEAIEQAAAGQFMGVALELGGKDPAYVRRDANFGHAIEQIVDGAFFNSGQSCCGIERVYVHHSVYHPFVEGVVKAVEGYKLGSPLDEQTTLGPLVNAKAAQHVRDQINDAVAKGATAHIAPSLFATNSNPDNRSNNHNSAYMAPQVLTEVNHQMAVMTEESFGPVIGIMSVADDEEAIGLMNDSPFGLTASIWTADENAARNIGDQLDTGTVFMNRCDYLDPALPWVGVKNSGRGCALSALGYDQLTRPKSFNFSHPT